MVALVARRGRISVPAATAVLLAASLAGLFVGNARLDAIDGRALTGATVTEEGAGHDGRRGPEAARTVSSTGVVESEPKRSRGAIRFPLRTGRGRVMVEAADPWPGRLPEAGEEWEARGRAGPAPDWYRPVMSRQGLKLILRAEAIRPTGERRGGLTGLIDRIPDRAETGLTRGMGPREAALARGFILGQDAAIDDRTVEDFRRSGLAHLLAVSGQNVVLLGLLAVPVLALLGVGIRARPVWIALLILLYVPLAGGGASIQRAGVMGLAGLAATAAGRASSRAWALLLAAAVTLGLDPRASADVGWQLSFAAVAGIAALAGPLRDRIAGVTGPGRWQTALAEGTAVTVSAALATAPLVAFHFEQLPLGTVAANLAALPAVAPSMWLGMAAGALSQIWSGLALPLNLVNSVLLAYVAEVAIWFGRPDRAVVAAEPGLPGLIAGSAGLALAVALTLRIWRRPAGEPTRFELRRARRSAAVILAALALAWVTVGQGLFDQDRRQLDSPPPGGARIEILDVGQGDAILIRPDRAAPSLIDGGPPGGDLAGALASAGVDRLAAVVLTHPDLDHYGGLPDLFGSAEVDRFLFDGAPPRLVAAARRAGAEPRRVGQGLRLRLGGGIRLELLWPPPDRAGADPEDRNVRSVAALLSWKRFRMFLPGDGEAEAVPVDPGPLDLLKVAHHGSEDAGLPALLARSRPAVAVIPVGEDNPYGHPAAQALEALSAARARVLRTDRDGTVSIVLEGDGYRLETGR